LKICSTSDDVADLAACALHREQIRGREIRQDLDEQLCRKIKEKGALAGWIHREWWVPVPVGLNTHWHWFRRVIIVGYRPRNLAPIETIVEQRRRRGMWPIAIVEQCQPLTVWWWEGQDDLNQPDGGLSYSK
jgi:hypothetical protein